MKRGHAPPHGGHGPEGVTFTGPPVRGDRDAPTPTSTETRSPEMNHPHYNHSTVAEFLAIALTAADGTPEKSLPTDTPEDNE